MKTYKKITILLLLFASFSVNLRAQEKRALTINDYARWRSITSASISDNGNWMTYAYRTPNADDTLYVKSLLSDKEIQIPGGSQPDFSGDSKWVAYTVSLPRKEAEKLRKDKKPVPLKVQLMNVVTGEKFIWENAAALNVIPSFRRRFQPENIPTYFSKDSRFFAVKKTKSDKEAKHKGTDLILRNLKEGYDEHFGSVAEFSFNKPGTMLAYTVDAKDTTGNGLIVVKLETGSRIVLDSDKAIYERLTWNKKGTALAVLKGNKKKEEKQRDNSLLIFTELDKETPLRTEYNPSDSYDFPREMVISEKGNLAISEDESKVFFGIKEQESEPEKKKDADPVADVDIFHWNDDLLQTVQKIRAERDRNFTYRSAFNLKNKRFVRLTDENMRNISITRDGKWGVGRNDRPYISDWKESKADYYRVNCATGERTLMFKAQGLTLGLSPDSKHFLYWKDKHVWLYKIETDEKINLTKNAPVSFVNAEFDRPGTKPPYGISGWIKDGNAVILSHRYDLLLQPLDGSSPLNLTNGEGERNEIRFRYIQLDPKERFIDLSKPVLLSAYGQWTKKAGYYRLSEGNLRKLIFDDKRFGNPIKAKNAERFIHTIETFADFPNYYMNDPDFSFPRKLTDSNPWQSEYNWGKRILFDYTNKDGVRLQGTLAVPDTYEPGQKLPMLVQFYEKYSQNLHRYEHPVFRDTPQLAKYVSNGYLAMQPDVHFNTRTTHDDMLDCVEAAVKKVIEMGYADPEHIGLHGHSFGGGGASFIATRSKMFAAIAAGAAPINLAGEFNILFHGSGQNNHQYDIYGQGRYGTNPYDDFELYRQQSPITHVRTMDTPLLYFHGTDDGSVEYNQGMEFYNALRFNGKKIIFASYPGQGHHLSKHENRVDYQTRMEQFFDHYLKDKPAPQWMTKGIPYLKKKKNN